MLEFDQAQTRLAEAGTPLARREVISLHSAAGRVLAVDINASGDLPAADNSAMDGYAIRFADFQNDVRLPIGQCCYAGDVPRPLAPGSAARIFTGALIPPGADTVVMQEYAEVEDGALRIVRAPRMSQNLRRRGEDIRAGELLLSAGTLLDASHIGLLASQGMSAVDVFERLRVGILTTGNEVVAAGQRRADGQIYNANGPMLAALVAGMGADPALILHAPDTEDDVKTAFASLLDRCDLVISIGGVSVGERDVVKPVLHALGGELDLWKVRMKPGKPVALAQVAGTPIVCLPGNPVAAFAVFALLATPLIRRMQGRAVLFPQTSLAALHTETPRQDVREEFLRVQYRRSAYLGAELLPYPQQGSAAIRALPWSTGLARLPAGTQIRDGESVQYYDFRHWLS